MPAEPGSVPQTDEASQEFFSKDDSRVEMFGWRFFYEMHNYAEMNTTARNPGIKMEDSTKVEKFSSRYDGSKWFEVMGTSGRISCQEK